ncbi:hypothetical protein F2P81_022933 [Scophthalmus maximus]|uniref:Uncharacterized protein n=1 Tax=Scophthalmus maximus TaxID=52904 RepID=A0A6A4RYS6_SCOMX|nr:hypothetical protein F2P81_022933 [Scophthalmus maximus]
MNNEADSVSTNIIFEEKHHSQGSQGASVTTLRRDGFQPGRGQCEVAAGRPARSTGLALCPASPHLHRDTTLECQRRRRDPTRVVTVNTVSSDRRENRNVEERKGNMEDEDVVVLGLQQQQRVPVGSWTFLKGSGSKLETQSEDDQQLLKEHLRCARLRLDDMDHMNNDINRSVVFHGTSRKSWTRGTLRRIWVVLFNHC